MFDTIIATKRPPRRGRLQAARTKVFEAYGNYLNAAPDLSALPRVVLSNDETEALIHAYEVETKAMAGLRAELMRPLILARCPFCGLGETSTLDHYLPKELHPQFAVFSRNLIPCCSPCNIRKGEQVVDKATDVRLFLHPMSTRSPPLYS